MAIGHFKPLTESLFLKLIAKIGVDDYVSSFYLRAKFGVKPSKGCFWNNRWNKTNSTLIETTVLFVGGPNAPQTNSKMADSRHLEKKWKIAISPHWIDLFLQNLAWWCILAPVPCQPVKFSEFQKSKTADCHHLGKLKNHNNILQQIDQFWQHLVWYAYLLYRLQGPKKC